ncbi:hypothetical protein IMCC3317_17380 [Kordia antarctica]|uniref:Transglutaminase-like domain-containing protein n=1 Tax=Kordia antarctica TaxID=1218801 RepID=A0A7L4ZJJ7_9FLAO|nr:transglutaminase domain-containing protein [Kordia antarctica]QHI36376.1 hypothetical protein IMCC3317_17380 [Kordia antarctica]
MLLKVNVSFLLFFCCHFLMIAQNYQHVDKVVDTYPKSFLSIEAFGNRIEKDFTEDADKVRAAYYWISNNIEYNYKELTTGKSNFPKIVINKFTGDTDYYNQWNKIYATHTLTYKTSVCEGYAQLLFFVCEHMNINAKVIDGNAKNSIHDIGVIARNVNHAWNAIYFNEQWNLIDATWSTGNEDTKPNYFDFDDSYYCVSPEKIIMSHFPKNPEWQLLTKKVSKKKFYIQPLIYVKYIGLNLSLDPTIRGTIRTKVNGFIELRFNIIDTTKVYYYAYEKDTHSTELELIKVGEKYVAKIPFKGKKRDYLSLFSGTEAFLSFKIIPTR